MLRPTASGAPAPEAVAFVALGSNLGDRLGHLRCGVAGLSEAPGVRVDARSGVYETAAHVLVPGEAHPAFLNAVVRLRTVRSPTDLLHVLLRIEAGCGRVRTRRWSPRTLDLDLLAYDGLALDVPGLVLPHPRLGERRFVLQPLADLAPDLYLPAPYAATVAELLRRTPDPGPVVRTDFRL